MALNIFKNCQTFNITLTVDWRSREDEVMKEMDQGSRGPWKDSDQYGLDLFTWKYINHFWSCKIDAFASKDYHLLQRYISRNRDEEAEARDFYAQNLKPGDLLFLHPHPKDTLKCLRQTKLTDN